MKKLLLFLLIPLSSFGQILNGPPTNNLVHIITLKNQESDVFLGDSYFMGEYTTKGKGVLNNVSNFTDRHIENYSLSGNTLNDIYSRITADSKTYHSTIGIKEYPAGGYAFIGSWRNEFNSGQSMYNSATMTAYLGNLRKVAEAAKALGYKPVIYSEYFTVSTSYGYLIQAALSNFCTENGYLFADIADKAGITRGTPDNPLFWDSSHPDVRTNTIDWYPLLKYYQSLPNAKNDIKIYRRRLQFTVSTVADLLYTTLGERTKAYKEIYIGQSAISDAQEKYYDDLTTLNTAGTYTSQIMNDYLKLQNNESVSFDDYGLIETTVNATADNIGTLSFNLKGVLSGTTAYVKDWITNTWVSITPTVNGTTYTYTLTNPKAQARYSKASLLIYKSGGFSLTDTRITWFGRDGKDLAQRPLPVELQTDELAVNPYIDANKSGWTTSGTVTVAVPSDNNVPQGASYVAPIDTVNYLTQTITFPSETEKTRRVQLKLTGRRNPPVFPSSGSYPSAAYVTSDTYDYGTLRAVVTYNSNNIVTYDKIVGMHWSEGLIEFDLPPNIPSVTVSIQGVGQYMEFAKFSAKVSDTKGIANKITYGSTKNLFDVSVAHDGQYMDNNGVRVASGTYGYSDFIAVTAGLTYYGTDGTNGMRKVTCYGDKDFASFIAGGNVNSSNSFTVPAGVNYVIISYTSSGKNKFQFEQGNTPTNWIPYAKNVFAVNGFPTKTNRLSILPTGKNLFNINDPDSKINYYLDASTGTPVSSTTLTYSGYIPVTAGVQYFGTDGTNTMRMVAYYNASKAFVSGGSTTSTNTFTPSAGVAFVRISYTTATSGTFQLEAGSSATTYAVFTGVISEINGYKSGASAIAAGYTVATLPTGVLGMVAFVTDATSPTYLGTLTGGGAVKCPVFYNGAAWVSY